MALQDAAVIAYARPFTQNKPFGPLKSEWGRFSDPQLQELHDNLVKLRNETVAHSDYAIRKVLIIPPGVPRPDGEPSKAGTDVTDITQKLHPRRFKKVAELCQHLGSRLNREIEAEVARQFDSAGIDEVFDLLTDETFDFTEELGLVDRAMKEEP